MYRVLFWCPLEKSVQPNKLWPPRRYYRLALFGNKNLAVLTDLLFDKEAINKQKRIKMEQKL